MKEDPISKNIYKILSEREMQILDLVVKGSTNAEIGKTLNLSPHTIKGHLTNILTKLNLKNRQQAVAYIMEKKFLADETISENNR